MSMPTLDTVVTGDVVMTWDGMNSTEITPAKDDKPESVKYSISFAIHPDAPELAELQQITEAFEKSMFPRGLPYGYTSAIRPINNDKIPELPGYKFGSAVTFKGVPPVFNADGREIPTAEFRQVFYPG